MIGRQLIEAARRRPQHPRTVPALQRAPRLADAAPLRACACDVDLAVFGHTQCGEAGVPWPEDPQVRRHLQGDTR